MLCDDLSPQRVARFVQVQRIGAKEIGAWLSFGIKHRREHLDEVQIFIPGGVFLDQMVGFPDLGNEPSSGRTWLD
jgi:hypothetical protein